jgi:hypothetical protein
MDKDQFMRDLTGIKRYMTMGEIIVIIGISGISGQVESGRKVVKGTT